MLTCIFCGTNTKSRQIHICKECKRYLPEHFDIYGSRLKVGDTVAIYNSNHEDIESVVCKNAQKEYISVYKNLKFINGVNSKYRLCITKKQSYKDIKHKTIINDIMYITEDKEI